MLTQRHQAGSSAPVPVDPTLLAKLQTEASTTASDSMAELARLLQRSNGWLDGFMENVWETARQGGSSRGAGCSLNAANFLKTPSRAKSHLHGTVHQTTAQQTESRKLLTDGAAKKLFTVELGVASSKAAVVAKAEDESDRKDKAESEKPAGVNSKQGMGVKRKREQGNDGRHSQQTIQVLPHLVLKPPPPPLYRQSVTSAFDSPTSAPSTQVPFIIASSRPAVPTAIPAQSMSSETPDTMVGSDRFVGSLPGAESVMHGAGDLEDPFLIRPSKGKTVQTQLESNFARTASPVLTFSKDAETTGSKQTETTERVKDDHASSLFPAASRGASSGIEQDKLSGGIEQNGNDDTGDALEEIRPIESVPSARMYTAPMDPASHEDQLLAVRDEATAASTSAIHNDAGRESGRQASPEISSRNPEESPALTAASTIEGAEPDFQPANFSQEESGDWANRVERPISEKIFEADDGVSIVVRRELIPAEVLPHIEAEGLTNDNGDMTVETPEVPETPYAPARVSANRTAEPSTELPMQESDTPSVAASPTEEGSSGEGDTTIKASPQRPAGAAEGLTVVEDRSRSAESVPSSSRTASLPSGLDDLMVPLNDGTNKTPSKPTPQISAKNAFSPSSVTFAALPPRDPLRARSIGGSNLHRMTNGSGEDNAPTTDAPALSNERSPPKSEIPDIVVPLKPESDVTADVSRRSSAERKQEKAKPKASVGVASAWLRQALAGAGGEEGLRKSMAAAPPRASQAPPRSSAVGGLEGSATQTKSSTARTARVHEATMDFQGKPEEGEAATQPITEPFAEKSNPLAPFRLLPSMDAQSRPQARATSGPGDAQQSTLSRMLANLQEKKEVARATAALATSVNRSTIGPLPSGGQDSAFGLGNDDNSGKAMRTLGRSTMGFSLLVRPEAVANTVPLPPPTAASPVNAPVVGNGGSSDDNHLHELYSVHSTLSVTIAPEEDGMRTNAGGPKDDPGNRTTATSSSNAVHVAAVTGPINFIPGPGSHSTRVPTPPPAEHKDRARSVAAGRTSPDRTTDHSQTLSRPIVSTTPPGSPPGSNRLDQTVPVNAGTQPDKQESKRNRRESDRRSKESDVRKDQGIARTTNPLLAIVPPSNKQRGSAGYISVNCEGPSGAPEIPAVAPGISHKGRPAQSEALVSSRETPIYVDSDSDCDDDIDVSPRCLSPLGDLDETVAMLERDLRLSRSPRPTRGNAARSSDASEARDEATPGLSRQNSHETDNSQSVKSSQTGPTKAVAGRCKGGPNAKFMQAEDIARKIDGIRPIVGPISSIARAQQARAKEQETAIKRIAEREAREKRKREEAAAKLDKERELANIAKKERAADDKRRRDALEARRREAEAKARRETREKVPPKASEVVAADRSQLAVSQPGKAKPLKVLKPSVLAPAGHMRTKDGARASPKPSIAYQPSKIAASPEVVLASIGPTRPPASKSSIKTGQGLVAPPQAQIISGPSAVSTQRIRPKTSLLRETIMKQQTHTQLRHSTITPARNTMRPGTSLLEFQRIVAAGGKGKGGSPDVRPEDIELPDIGSDFGFSDADSDDGKAKRADKGRPSWADSPALRKAAADQAKMNPGLLFGPMPEFRMESIFGGARTKIRSSSANWGGQDRLTEQEKLEYTKKMNYRALDDAALGHLLQSPDPRA